MEKELTVELTRDGGEYLCAAEFGIDGEQDPLSLLGRIEEAIRSLDDDGRQTERGDFYYSISTPEVLGVLAAPDGVQPKRRGRRPKKQPETETFAEVKETAPSGNPQKKERRRNIDPTTCERDYSADEFEFMKALELYKRTSGRMFPTCSETLEVIRDLGYVKMTKSEKTDDGENVFLAAPVPAAVPDSPEEFGCILWNEEETYSFIA